MYSNSKTELGKFLSNFVYSPMQHPEFGHFNSIEGFWWWLSTGRRHDVLRNTHGLEARNLGKSLERIPYQNFEEEIKKAIRIKIENNPKYKMMLVINKLPLKHYYLFKNGGEPTIYIVPQMHWQVKFIEDLANEYRKTPDKIKITLGEKPAIQNKIIKTHVLITDPFAKREIEEINKVL